MRSHRTVGGHAALRLSRIVLFTYLFAVFPPCHVLSQQDPMLAHLDSAHTALRAGDQTRASVEYKAFLAEAIHRIANARARMGDLLNADHNFEEAMAFANGDPTVQLDYASLLFDQRRFSEAQALAGSAFNVIPDNTRAQILLGRINFEQRQYSEAARLLKTAAGKGEFREVWGLLALSYLRAQQLTLAQPVLKKALRIIGENANNRVMIATIYYYGDYPDPAISELRKALAQDPQASDAHYYLGLAYLGNNESAGYAKAVSEFETQLKTTPRDFRSHYMLGYIALQQHAIGQAEQQLIEARQLNPDDKGTRLILGQLYSETSRVKEAIDVLRSLAAESSNGGPADLIDVRAHYMLGRLLQQAGEIQEGAAEIEVAEHLRRELRASSEEITSRTSMSTASQFINRTSQSNHSVTIASPEERERADAFVQQLVPLVGEAYYNLARIAALHHDRETASEYSARAAAWDPSLAPQARH